MKAVLINGSPRKKNWNTVTLLEKAADGLKECGFETEIINLYDQLFHGCISCFLCKRKKFIDKHICQYKDNLTPILEKSMEANVIVVGSPVYLGEPTGETRCYLERLQFPVTSYMVDENGNKVSILTEPKPTAMIYTMNCPVDYMDQIGYPILLGNSANAFEALFGYSEILYACDTYQFRDYSQYEASMFDPVHKVEMKEKQFPIDCQKAFELGKRLGKVALDLKNK